MIVLEDQTYFLMVIGVFLAIVLLVIGVAGVMSSGTKNVVCFSKEKSESKA